LLAASGCDQVDGVDCEPYLNTLFRLPPAEKIVKFEGYDLPTQYQIYLCGVQVVHPPALELANALANRGAVATPFLKEKLSSTSDEVTIRDLTMVFVQMTKNGTYDVRADEDLMRTLRVKVKSMNGVWKETARAMLSDIEKGEANASHE
jgi:hypothetical protein